MMCKMLPGYWFCISHVLLKTVPLVIFMLMLGGCKKSAPTTSNNNIGSYRMGFAVSAPNGQLVLQSLNMWATRADAAIISTQIPWGVLYGGTSPETYINQNYKDLVNFYRTKNFKVWVYLDPANGLDRTANAADLAALGKSIAQPEPQTRFARFAFLMDSLLKPDHIGLALETNAIRTSSPSNIYQGVKAAANLAANSIKAYDKNVKLSVSIQADFAWGLLNGTAYQGIDADFDDFSFIQELGISSYPYLVYNQPQDIPANYYSRLLQGHSLPVFISEGGWSSQAVANYSETLQKQQDYITKQSSLLDGINAIAYFQLTFTDFEQSTFPPGTPAIISLFTHIGLVDTTLQAKPALSAWDNTFHRTLKPGN